MMLQLMVYAVISTISCTGGGELVRQDSAWSYSASPGMSLRLPSTPKQCIVLADGTLLEIRLSRGLALADVKSGRLVRLVGTLEPPEPVFWNSRRLELSWMLARTCDGAPIYSYIERWNARKHVFEPKKGASRPPVKPEIMLKALPGGWPRLGKRLDLWKVFAVTSSSGGDDDPADMPIPVGLTSVSDGSWWDPGYSAGPGTTLVLKGPLTRVLGLEFRLSSRPAGHTFAVKAGNTALSVSVPPPQCHHHGNRRRRSRCALTFFRVAFPKPVKTSCMEVVYPFRNPFLGGVHVVTDIELSPDPAREITLMTDSGEISPLEAARLLVQARADIRHLQPASPAAREAILRAAMRQGEVSVMVRGLAWAKGRLLKELESRLKTLPAAAPELRRMYLSSAWSPVVRARALRLAAVLEVVKPQDLNVLLSDGGRKDRVYRRALVSGAASPALLEHACGIRGKFAAALALGVEWTRHSPSLRRTLGTCVAAHEPVSFRERMYYVAALELLGKIRRIMTFLKDRSPHVRGRAWLALWRIKASRPWVKQRLRRLKDPYVVWWLLRDLDSPFSGIGQVYQAVRGWPYLAGRLLRLAASDCVKELSPMISGLLRPSHPLYYPALSAVGKCKIVRYVPDLIELFKKYGLRDEGYSAASALLESGWKQASDEVADVLARELAKPYPPGSVYDSHAIDLVEHMRVSSCDIVARLHRIALKHHRSAVAKAMRCHNPACLISPSSM